VYVVLTYKAKEDTMKNFGGVKKGEIPEGKRGERGVNFGQAQGGITGNWQGA